MSRRRRPTGSLQLPPGRARALVSLATGCFAAHRSRSPHHKRPPEACNYPQVRRQEELAPARSDKPAQHGRAVTHRMISPRARARCPACPAFTLAFASALQDSDGSQLGRRHEASRLESTLAAGQCPRAATSVAPVTHITGLARRCTAWTSVVARGLGAWPDAPGGRVAREGTGRRQPAKVRHSPPSTYKAINDSCEIVGTVLQGGESRSLPVRTPASGSAASTTACRGVDSPEPRPPAPPTAQPAARASCATHCATTRLRPPRLAA